MRDLAVPDTMVAVVSAMLTFDASRRPDAGAVAERCMALEAELSGPSLREWSLPRVDSALAMVSSPNEDEWTGTLKTVQGPASHTTAADEEDTGETTASLQMVASIQPQEPIGHYRFDLPSEMTDTGEPAQRTHEPHTPLNLQYAMAILAGATVLTLILALASGTL